MVSLADGNRDNNALGYCTSKSINPNTIISLTPLENGWSKWAMRGTRVVVKWLNLPGEPEFLHTLDGETSITTRLPRRLLQRFPDDVVTIVTAEGRWYPVETVLQYGTCSTFEGNTLSVTPLGVWACDLQMGSAVKLSNLSDPANAVKNGIFGSQSTVVKRSATRVMFLKDTPGGG